MGLGQWPWTALRYDSAVYHIWFSTSLQNPDIEVWTYRRFTTVPIIDSIVHHGLRKCAHAAVTLLFLRYKPRTYKGHLGQTTTPLWPPRHHLQVCRHTDNEEAKESVQSALAALAAYTPVANYGEAGHPDPVLLQMFIKLTTSLVTKQYCDVTFEWIRRSLYWV